MNRLLFIAALLGILLQNFGKVYILLRFEMNQAYIAKTLCVKKDEPDNCCKGHCYLNKQLEEEDKKEKSPASTGIKDKEEIQYCQINQSFVFYSSSFIEIKTPYCPYVSEGIGSTIFRPPKV